MLKPLAILVSLCLLAVPALAGAGAPDSSSDKKKEEAEPKPVILDLTPLNMGKYYVIDNIVFRESNTVPDLQPEPFYSEGKKKIIEGDEKILA